MKQRLIGSVFALALTVALMAPGVLGQAPQPSTSRLTTAPSLGTVAPDFELLRSTRSGSAPNLRGIIVFLGSRDLVPACYRLLQTYDSFARFWRIFR